MEDCLFGQSSFFVQVPGVVWQRENGGVEVLYVLLCGKWGGMNAGSGFAFNLLTSLRGCYSKIYLSISLKAKNI